MAVLGLVGGGDGARDSVGTCTGSEGVGAGDSEELPGGDGDGAEKEAAGGVD